MVYKPVSGPGFMTARPMASDCFDAISTNVTRDAQQALGLYAVYMSLLEYIPMINYQGTTRNATLNCLADSSIGDVISEYKSLVNRFSSELPNKLPIDELGLAIGAGDINKARRLLNTIEDALESMGLDTHARQFRAVGESMIASVKHGEVDKALELVGRAFGILTRAEFEYVTRELASKYMVLWAGEYAMVLLKPPRTGVYNVTPGFIQMLVDVSRLFPSEIRIQADPDDDDAAFIDAVRRVSPRYVGRLVRMYLVANGFDPGLAGLASVTPYTVASTVRTIRSGFLSVVAAWGGSIYVIEHPTVKFVSSGDKNTDLRHLLVIDVIMKSLSRLRM